MVEEQENEVTKVDLVNMLDNEIKSEFQKLSNLTPGSKEHVAAVQSLTSLYHLANEEQEQVAKFMEKSGELKQQRIDRWVRVGTTILEVLTPIAFYNLWMRKGFQFEETGTITSTTFRNLISKFKPTRK